MDMATKQVTRYEIREFVGSSFSKSLGRKLRDRSAAARIVRRLKKQKRDVFSVPFRISA
jgi:hypothetical protein